METRIFFKDKTDTLKGPYTERQVQEWYREGWFDSTMLFYFTESDDPPTDLRTSGITLDCLLSHNGIACPFIELNDELKSEFGKNRDAKEMKLTNIEKEIAALQLKSAEISFLEEQIERVERRLEIISTQRPDDENHESQQTSEFVLVSNPKQEDPTVEEMGHSIATYLLDVYECYGTGDFGSWDKDRVTKVVPADHFDRMSNEISGFFCELERILIARLREKEFFCCVLCQQVMFNYKQALVHFYSNDHKFKETPAIKATDVWNYRVFIDQCVTKLQNTLFEKAVRSENERLNKYGRPVARKYRARNRPSSQFLQTWFGQYADALMGRSCDQKTFFARMQVAIDMAKSELGARAMAELHEHLNKSQTFCDECEYNTGDREGFYAHIVNYVHMRNIVAKSGGVDMITMLVNVHRKEFI